RRAVDRQLLPPDPVQGRRRVQPRRGPADRNPPAGPRGLQRGLPGRLADVLEHDLDALALGRLLDGGTDVAARVVDGGVGTELARSRVLAVVVATGLARSRELLVARRGDEHPRAERLRDRQAGGGDTAADPPE